MTKQQARNRICLDLIGVVLGIALLFLIAGCGTFGNGKIDAPVDVEVVYTSPKTGIEYRVTTDENGLHVALGMDGSKLIQSEDGSVTLTDPAGNYVKFTPVE